MGPNKHLIPFSRNFKLKLLQVDRDKNSATNGASVIHLPDELRILTDLYDNARTKKFQGQSSPHSSDPGWLENESTVFFLKANCSPYTSIDFKFYSDIIGFKVTAYDFRDLITT